MITFANFFFVTLFLAQMKPTMSSHSNLGHYVVKPAAVGAAGAAASFMLHGSKASITIRGTTVPLSLALGAGMFVGSILGEFVHDKLFPLAGPTNRLTNPMGEAVTIGTMAGANALLMSLNEPGDLQTFGLPSLIGIAAGAKIVGSYCYDHFLAPMVLGENMYQ